MQRHKSMTRGRDGNASLRSSMKNRPLKTLMLIAVVVGGLASFAGWDKPAHAREPAAATQAPTVLLGAVFARKNSADSPVKNEQTLSTRPIGTYVVRTLAEVEDLEAVKPGALVDVKLSSLTDEGPKTDRILPKITVYSIGEWNPGEEGLTELPPVKPEKAAEEKGGAKKKIEKPVKVNPMRVVGLLVKRSQLETLRLAEAQGIILVAPARAEQTGSTFSQIWHNFTTNLFQPLLLFFFMGFSVPLLKVPLEFPKQLYQSLTLYLLVAIGWHGGELMAKLPSAELAVAGGLVVVGFCTNGFIGVFATKVLRWFTPMRQIDAVTVGAYYGSDSAGTFVTCLGILAVLGIQYQSYMPVMLAVMEIPGCLVGLFLVSRLRRDKMDLHGNMPGEPGYGVTASETGDATAAAQGHASPEQEPAHGSVGAMASGHGGGESIFSWKIAHEVFLNPGLFLLFGGIIVGFISGLQAAEDPHVVEEPNHLFIFLFKGALCLFLLEMGITACQRLRDLKTAGWGFIAFGVLAPNVFAVIGMIVLHIYSIAIWHSFDLGTYALFAVLCAAASYIAVPAVQRLAIPEASPTLPLAASLGLTFTWNVTLGIPIYIEIAKAIIAAKPVG